MDNNERGRDERSISLINALLTPDNRQKIINCAKSIGIDIREIYKATTYKCYDTIAKHEDEPEDKYDKKLHIYVDLQDDESCTYRFHAWDGKLTDVDPAKLGPYSLDSNKLLEKGTALYKETKKNLEFEERKVKEDRLEDFTRKYEKLVANKADAAGHKRCPIAHRKQLKFLPDSDAFVVTETKCKGNPHPETKVKSNGLREFALVIPFHFLSKDDNRVLKKEVVNAQVRFVDKLRSNTSAAMGLHKGSASGSYHCLQKGRVNDAVNMPIIFLVESYSTANAIAQARPDDAVYCCAGISMQRGMAKEFRAKFGRAAHLVLVLDKPEGHKESLDLERLTNFALDEDIAYIQLPYKYMEMTDYNDYLCKHGLADLELLLESQLKDLLPEEIAVVGADHQGYQILRSNDNKPRIIPRNNILNGCQEAGIMPYANFLLRNLNITKASEERIRTMEGEDGKKARAKLKRRKELVLKKELNRLLDASCENKKGLGVHFDKSFYLLNTSHGRYKITPPKGKGEPTLRRVDRFKPGGKNLYFRMPTSRNVDDKKLDQPFTEDTIKQYINTFKSLFNKEDHFKALPFLGYFAHTGYASFSPLRTHLWLYGGTTKGKTTVQKMMRRLLPGLSVTANESSAPGFRQAMNIMDGVLSCGYISSDEVNPAGSKRNLAGLLDLSKLAATGEMADQVKKGRPDQNVITHLNMYSMCFASEEVWFKEDQQYGRWLGTEMHGLDEMQSRADKNPEDERYDYSAIMKRFENLSDQFTRGMALGSVYYLRLQKLVAPMIRPRINKHLSKHAHKANTLSCPIAALAALYKVANQELTLKQAAEKAIKDFDEFIVDQIIFHRQQDIVSSIQIARFRNIRITAGGLDRQLLKAFLLPSDGGVNAKPNDEKRRELYEQTAMWVDGDENMLYIHKNMFHKASAFLEEHSDGFKISKTMLSSWVAQKNPAIKMTEARPVGAHRDAPKAYCYQIYLGGDRDLDPSDVEKEVKKC